ncbi:diaminopimelate epimerase [Thermodesulfobacteriota bacterium]
MNTVPFFKMSGSGNDFIIIDNRSHMVNEDQLIEFVTRICRRKMSVGSDGFILLEDTEGADFKWRFYNSDGSAAEMCGNGARCVARFAYLNGIAGTDMSFETEAGIVHAEVRNERVKINLPDPADLQMDYAIELKNGSRSVCSINTGVPHVVVPTDNLADADVVALGREIRFHSQYSPAGTNVNFIRSLDGDGIAIRTYERGVEDETLACGTGAVASAIVSAVKFGKHSPVDVLTQSGGHLNIYFDEKEGTFRDIFLEGDARVIYKGELWEDAWK